MTAAERYLLLALRLGRHVDGLVDSYYGPAELQQQAKPRARSTRRSSQQTAMRCSPSCRTAGSTTR